MLLIFLSGEEFDTAKITFAQWIGFLFFPVGLVAGFIVGWRNEMLGGIISISSLLGFYFIYGLLITGKIPRGLWFIVFALPGFFFLACGIYEHFSIGKLTEKISADVMKN
jgi:hypothetical protein